MIRINWVNRYYGYYGVAVASLIILMFGFCLPDMRMKFVLLVILK